MSNKPTFSVIIPTYNREHVLGRAITSVLAQTFKDYELIIVDDGSKDNTEDLLKTYHDKRIIYLKHEKNKGQNQALNTGLTYAIGTFISFLDSDDEWLPEMLQKQFEKFGDGNNYDCVYSRCVAVRPSGEKIEGHQFQLEGYNYTGALKQGYVSSMISLSVKKTCFDKIGQFDVEFKNCQDDDICLRLAKYFSFGLIKEPLAIVHLDGGGQVTANTAEYASGWLKLFNKHKDDILEHCGTDVLGNHYLKCAKLFLQARNRNKTRELVSLSFNYRYTLKGILLLIATYFPFSFFDNCNRVLRFLKS